MIYVKYRGKLGNILFQHAFCKLLSKLANSQVSALKDNFVVAKERVKDIIVGFDDIKVVDHVKENTDNFLIDSKNCYDLNFQEVIKIAKHKNIILDGFPHNWDYFKENSDWIKEEIKVKDGDFFETNDLVVGIRIGDYLDEKHIKRFFYPLESVANLLKTIHFNQLTIVTDSPKHQFVQELKNKYQSNVISKNILYDFTTTMKGSRLVITPSTFFWWASFLGSAEEIYFPYNMGSWRYEKKIYPIQDRIKFFNSKGRSLNE
jgi:hypothetical protein